MTQPQLELIRTNLRRYTFSSPKIKNWVEENCIGKVLNLFCGKTLLKVDEIRNDVNIDMPANYHKEAITFIKEYSGEDFNTIILDPPYSYRKSIEMYSRKRCSSFKILADTIYEKYKDKNLRIISFGYHSTFMGKVRNFNLIKLCIFAHGGAQHCTIGIVEEPEQDDIFGEKK